MLHQKSIATINSVVFWIPSHNYYLSIIIWMKGMTVSSGLDPLSAAIFEKPGNFTAGGTPTHRTIGNDNSLFC